MPNDMIWIDGKQRRMTDDEQAAFDAQRAVDSVPRTPTPEETRAEAFRSDASRVDLLDRLRNATPAQIDSWYDANVNTVAKRDALMKAMLKLIALDART